MALRLNGSTSGYVELNAPAVAPSTSFTVPNGIVKVEQTLLTATNSFSTASSGAWFDVPNLTVNITTAMPSSKIIVNAFVFGEHTDQEPDKSFKVVRTVGGSSTDISAPGSGSRPGVWNIMLPGWVSGETGTTPSGTPMNNYIDSPGQSAGTTITYKVQVWSQNAGSTMYINRTTADSNTTNTERGMSYINVMEVAV